MKLASLLLCLILLSGCAATAAIPTLPFLGGGKLDVSININITVNHNAPATK